MMTNDLDELLVNLSELPAGSTKLKESIAKVIKRYKYVEDRVIKLEEAITTQASKRDQLEIELNGSLKRLDSSVNRLDIDLNSTNHDLRTLEKICSEQVDSINKLASAINGAYGSDGLIQRLQDAQREVMKLKDALHKAELEKVSVKADIAQLKEKLINKDKLDKEQSEDIKKIDQWKHKVIGYSLIGSLVISAIISSLAKYLMDSILKNNP